jgi:NADH:ubiquinone oxidoreductase subunit 5 (subunit L)/multisubunit Na+/H+ antiporter MnhA subunit
MAAVCLNLSAGTLYFNGSAAYVSVLATKSLDFGFGQIAYSSLLLASLMVASFCKSAQFGFHFWLPDSMEAPVPASALIHSATLVSAGIYAMLRFNLLLLSSPVLSSVFAGVTALTAFYGAVIAGFQTDVKKVLAYSTISHCGMLMFSILMHMPYVTLFYLFAHGFFKSLNFMCVGNYIQHSNNYQDVSRMGRFLGALSFERNVFTVTLFNLSSAPLFLCFFSKHWLLASTFINTYLDPLVVCLIYGAAFSGFFYSAKLLFECLIASKRAHASVYSVNTSRAISGLYRRSNATARWAIWVLCAASFVCLYYMWLISADAMQTWADDYSARVGPATSYSNYLTDLLFSSLLAITASVYLVYKRQAASPSISALAFLVLAAVVAL